MTIYRILDCFIRVFKLLILTGAERSGPILNNVKTICHWLFLFYWWWNVSEWGMIVDGLQWQQARMVVMDDVTEHSTITKWCGEVGHLTKRTTNKIAPASKLTTLLESLVCVINLLAHRNTIYGTNSLAPL